MNGHPTATDLADYLVRALAMPFRDAHHVTGSLVALADEKKLSLWDLPLDAMQVIEPRLTDAVFDVLSVEASVASRTSEGGTAPSQVKQAILNAKQRFLTKK